MLRHSLLCYALEALCSRKLGYTKCSWSSSRRWALLSSPALSDAHPCHDKALLCSVSQTPRAVRSSRVLYTLDDSVSPPRDRGLAKVLIELSILALLPCLRHMLVCTHHISPTFSLPVSTLQIVTTHENRSIKLVPTEYRALGFARRSRIRSRYGG